MSSNDADADDNKDYNNPLGYDNPTGGGSSSDKESSSYNDKSPPERIWYNTSDPTFGDF
jgi:hypothetical protein